MARSAAYSEMMNPRPARRMYASPPPPRGTATTRASPDARRPASLRRRRCDRAPSCRRAPAAQRAIHRVAHDDVLLARRATQRLLRARRVDAAERHRGAGAQLGVLAAAEQGLAVAASRRACETPSSPHSAPYASKTAIFSVRSASRIALALHDRVELRQHRAIARAPCSARTAATRTSRSASSSPRSSACSAPGEPISPSACTAATRSAASPSLQHLARAARPRRASSARRRAASPRAPRPVPSSAMSFTSSAVFCDAESRRGLLEHRAQLHVLDAARATRAPSPAPGRAAARTARRRSVGGGSVAASSSDCSSCVSGSGRAQSRRDLREPLALAPAAAPRRARPRPATRACR